MKVKSWWPVKKVSLIFFLLFVFGSLTGASAQSILKRIKSKVEEKVSERVIDEADNALSKSLDKDADSAQESTKEKDELKDTKENSNQQFSMTKAFGKYDFVPGDTVIYYNDFLNEALSELPIEWNSNASSVVNQLEGISGQWLRIAQKSVNLTDNRKAFGSDFTVEFDAFLQFDFKGWLPPSFRFGMLATGAEDPGSNKLLSDPKGDKSFYVELSPLHNGANILLESNKQHLRYFHSPVTFNPVAKNWYSKVIHVAIQLQKERLRIWIEGNKIYDSPKAIAAEGVFNQLYFQLSSSSYQPEQVGVYVSNIKIAKGIPDSRNKLMEAGSFSTTGIGFDSGSSVIKPESSGVLKMMGDLLKSNANLKLRIIGHTDAVGEEKANQQLSEQRAMAVKNALKTEYGVDESRLEAVGKGESEPVGDNHTKQGMAQNRRIEFMKL
jgi:OOP family OmpA-OmpF porin